MSDHALYFMPDISGFTNFVAATEIEHSKHIISELLEILLDSNTIGLKLVEIEGDALFMYVTEFPSFQVLVAQAKQMLSAFAKHLDLYSTSRICECGACTSAQDLQVKFLVHYGEISFIRVKDIIKPYGVDVIKIHRLLKNSIPTDQYLLMSKSVLDFYNVKDQEISDFTMNQDVYDYGISEYAYTNLNAFIKPTKKSKILIKKPERKPEIKFVIKTLGEINDIYNFISDLRNRLQWYLFPDKIEFDDFRINRAGAVHQCIVGNSVLDIEAILWHLKPHERGYGERTSSMPNIDEYQYYITLKQKGEFVEIKLEVFADFNVELKDPKELLVQLTNAWKQSLDLLVEKTNNL